MEHTIDVSKVILVVDCTPPPPPLPSPPLHHGFSDAANTNLSILGDSRKTSINEVSFAHDDINLEKAIPEAVNEEDEIKGEESKL